MKSIGILYIATGPYIVFWEEFYKTFERFFLPDTERHYYVFTDAEDIAGEMENPKIHRIYQNPEPWPLPTLLKYHRFLEAEAELLKHDYLYQSNGPIICEASVKESEFLPRTECGEELMFTLHPGYYNKPARLYPYERNPKSQAYVPYNQGETYVFGAMNGGTAEAYVRLMRELDKAITLDLNHNIIARFHDESHVNHKVCSLRNYRLLPFSYGYPDGLDVPGERMISCVNKEKYFDVNSMKGLDEEYPFGKKVEMVVHKHIISKLLWMRDSMLQRKVTE